MNAKEFFRSVYDAALDVKRIRARKAIYEELSTALSGGMTGDVVIRTNDKHSRVENVAIRLADLADELGQAAARCEMLYRAAERVIGYVESPVSRSLLSMRYIERRSWKKIMEEMEYSDLDSAYKAHGRALQDADKIMGKLQQEQ